MEFLVFCEIEFTPDVTTERQEELRAAEAARARELQEAGLLMRLWRVPGQRANYGLWEAADATELHDALSSLPLFPYMRIHVEALAGHPNDPRKTGAVPG